MLAATTPNDRTARVRAEAETTLLRNWREGEHDGVPSAVALDLLRPADTSS